jgi:hypothetical protein
LNGTEVNQIDITNTVAELWSSKARGASEEKIRRSFNKICLYNDTIATGDRGALAEMDGGIILKLVEAILEGAANCEAPGVGVGGVGSDRPHPIALLLILNEFTRVKQSLLLVGLKEKFHKTASISRSLEFLCGLR